MKSSDNQLSAIARKSIKETTYHFRHSSKWIIRLGDGTEESHIKVQSAIDNLWMFTNELFEMNDIDTSNSGIFSISHHNSSLYMLAVKQNEDALITMDYNNLTVQETEMISDSTVVGIAILNNSIYLSYRDRRIEKFKDL